MEDDLPRKRGDAASLMGQEPLDTYSQAELLDRVAQLETEIVRVKAQHAKAADHRKLADLLFKPPSSSIGAAE